MRIKRVLQGTALTALAAAAWIGAGTVDASAATIPDGNIKVNAAKQEMTVKTDDAEVLFAVGTFNARNKSVKVSVWDVYEANGDVKIDLSKLNNTKDNYLVVKTEKADPTYIKVPASLKKQKLTFDASANTLTIDVDSPTGVWEYRTSYGDWKTLDTTKTDLFKEYQYQGASLYVRAAAATSSSITSTSGDDNKVYDAAIKNPEDKDKVNVYTAGSLPGKETKLNIAKQANGPSVTADYVNKEVKIKKNTQYRVWTADASNNYSKKGDIITVSDATTLKLDELLGSASSGVIEVRTPAKDANAQGKGSKVASKWTRVELKKTENIALASGITANTNLASGATVSEGITVEATALTGRNAGKYNVTIKNASGSAINVHVVGSEAKPTKVNAVKNTTPGKVTLKNVESGKSIEMAIAGDKKAKTWAGGYITVGKLGE